MTGAEQLQQALYERQLFYSVFYSAFLLKCLSITETQPLIFFCLTSAEGLNPAGPYTCVDRTNYKLNLPDLK